MSFTRRQFLLSTAGASVGAIIPSFYYRALEFFEQFGKPLLVQPARFSQDLCVLHNYDHLELYLGDPFQDPPAMTYREFFTRYDPAGLETFEQDWGRKLADLDLEIHYEYVMNYWFMRDGPGPRAYDLLESLDLGDLFDGPDAVGALDFVTESNMVSMWRYARPQDEVTLSLLQQRLNDLDTGIRLVTGYSV